MLIKEAEKNIFRQGQVSISLRRRFQKKKNHHQLLAPRVVFGLTASYDNLQSRPKISKSDLLFSISSSIGELLPNGPKRPDFVFCELILLDQKLLVHQVKD